MSQKKVLINVAEAAKSWRSGCNEMDKQYGSHHCEGYCRLCSAFIKEGYCGDVACLFNAHEQYCDAGYNETVGRGLSECICRAALRKPKNMCKVCGKLVKGKNRWGLCFDCANTI